MANKQSNRVSIPTLTCPKCGGEMQCREIGFLPEILLVIAYILGLGVVIAYFGAIFSGKLHAPTGAGGGKFIVFLPIFIWYLIINIKKNLKRKILFCETCKE